MYLSVPLPKMRGLDLTDCIEQFAKEEYLEGDNSWYKFNVI
jgi:ubiquitin C-terminal hydrolase